MESARSILTALAVCVVGGLLVFAAARGLAQETTSKSDASPSAGTAVASPEGSPTASPVAARSPSAATETTIVMGKPSEYSFEPKELTIAANVDVTITLRNEGTLVHDFHIRELSVNSKDVEPGESTTVTINAAPGEYEYYCDEGEHRSYGMVGTLVVE
jgi:plastocyanin